MGGPARRLVPSTVRRAWPLWLAGFLALAALAGNGLLFYRNTQTLVERDRLVTRTQTVLANLDRTLLLLTDAETGQRGYILTGQTRYLQPYQLAVRQIGPQLAGLQRATADNPVQQRRLPQLRSLVAAKLAELAQTVALRQQGHVARAQQIVLSGRGVELMDSSRALLATMTRTALARLGDRTAQAGQAQTATTVALVVGTGGSMALLIALLLALSLLLAREHEARTRLVAIVDSSNDAIIGKSLEGIVESWNPGAARLYGYSAAEVIGRHISLLAPPDRVDEPDRIIERIRRGELIAHFETVRVRKDGSSVDVSLAISPIRDSTGRIVGAATIARDITEQARARQAAEQARAAAEAAARLREEFLSIAGHELRTPLTSALGNVQLVSKWVAGDDLPAGRLAQVRTALQRTERQALRLQRLVQDLLDASRIQADRLELRLARCDLAPIVEEVVAEHRLLAPSRTIHLEVRAAEAMPVLVDAERIAQVVINYLSNALRYSAADRPVTVGLAVEERGGDVAARVWVQDAGPGLAAAEHERVWERFYRSEEVSHQSGSSEGLGLGLYICRSIVERHQGQVGVESEPEAGARFWFTLPLAVTEEVGDGAAGVAGTRVPAGSAAERSRVASGGRG